MNFPRILKKRKGYIDRIKPFMQKSVAKVLTGQRRVGKSFLLYQPVSYTHLTLPTTSRV